MEYDAIVIGSGFGGAPVVLRLAEAGYRVLVLERGRRWQAPDVDPTPGNEARRRESTLYPRAKDDPWIYDADNPAKSSGWVELRRFSGMWVVNGAGVGGGSLHFSNVSVEPSTASFGQGWPKPFRDDPSLLGPYVERVGQTLGVEPLPENQLTERNKLVREAHQNLGLAPERLRQLPLTVRFDGNFELERADGDDPRQAKFTQPAINEHGIQTGTCVHLGNCNIGCDVNARKILDTNYLPAAEALGAEIRPLHLVRWIMPVDGGYEVHFDKIDPGTETTEQGKISARIVVLSCGSMGSTELLLRCRDVHHTLPELSRHLGKNWSPNGDFFTPANYDRPLHLAQGPPITAAVDYVDEPDAGGQRYFIQDVGFPNVLGGWVREKMGGTGGGGLVSRMFKYAADTLAHADDSDNDSNDDSDGDTPFDKLMLWFAQGQDAADGEMRLRRKYFFGLFGPKELDLRWDPQRSQPNFEAIGATQKKFTEATGGRTLAPFNLGKFPEFLASFHPLGGCNMADPAGEGVVYESHGRRRRTDEGVVGHHGEVFGYRNLYVSDGAVIPQALGRNPSRTIAAVAERIAEMIVQEGR